MYCPVCLNDTLKIASSGVVKLSFNKKARSTSQLFYNLKNDKDADLLLKFKNVIEDYFNWYSEFKNKNPIKEVQAYSMDFICQHGCKMTVNTHLSVIGLLISKKELQKLIKEVAATHNIEISPKLIIE